MGLFSKLSASSDIEKKLEAQYVPMLQETHGMTLQEAKNIFKNLLSLAKEEANEQGSTRLPPNLGDKLLSEPSSNHIIKKARSHGVKDEDMKLYWNMHYLERHIMIVHDTWCGYSFFLKLTKEDGMTVEEAGNHIKKSRPIFGNPDDTTVSKGDR